jgi:hypothetical protein
VKALTHAVWPLLLLACGGSGADDGGGGGALFGESFVLAPGSTATSDVSGAITGTLTFPSDPTGTDFMGPEIHAISGLAPDGVVILSHYDASNPSYRPAQPTDPWASRVRSGDRFVLVLSDTPIDCGSDLAPGDDRPDGFLAVWLYEPARLDAITADTPALSRERRARAAYGEHADYSQASYSEALGAGVDLTDARSDAITVAIDTDRVFAGPDGAQATLTGTADVVRCN